MIADIQSPDEETKMAIIFRKAEAEGTRIPAALAQVIANQVRSNIRELEGLLNRVLNFSSLTGRPPTVELALETLRDVPQEGGLKPPAADIIRFVSRHYDLKVTEIKSKSRAREVAIPRQVAMYLCKKLTDLSYPEIGKLFSYQHHSVVMYAVDKVEHLRKADPDFDRMIANFERYFA